MPRGFLSALTAQIILWIASTAAAQWSPQAQDLVRSYNQQFIDKSGFELLLCESELDRNPYLRQTAEAAEIMALNFVRDWSVNTLYPGSERVRLPLQSHAFTQVGGEYFMPATVVWQKRNGAIVPAEMVVFNPGIFQALDSPFVSRSVERFYSRGYHVLVIPNPFTEDYLNAMPVANPGSLEREASVELEAIQSARGLWGRYIKKLHLAGMSYGGFITAVSADLDRRSAVPLIDGQVTIFGPQVKLGHSLKLLDDLIDMYMDDFNFHVFQKVIGYVFHDHMATVEEHARAQYLYHKSHQFNDLTYSPDVARAYESIPNPNTRPHAYQNWRSQIRFLKVLPVFSPENLPFFSSGHDEIGRWLLDLANAGTNRFRVLTTADDFTNQTSDWQQYFPHEIAGPDHFLVRVHGAHNAYVMSDWYREFMDASF